MWEVQVKEKYICFVVEEQSLKISVFKELEQQQENNGFLNEHIVLNIT